MSADRERVCCECGRPFDAYEPVGVVVEPDGTEGDEFHLHCFPEPEEESDT